MKESQSKTPEKTTNTSGLNSGCYGPALSGAKPYSLSSPTEVEATLERIRLNRMKAGPAQYPAVGRRMLETYQFRERMMQSPFHTVDIEVNGQRFLNALVPHSTMGTQAYVPCHNLGWCKIRSGNQHILNFDLCPRHQAHATMQDLPFDAVQFPGYYHHVAQAVLENSTYVNNDVYEWPSQTELKRVKPKFAADLIANTFMWGKANWMPNQVTFKVFPSYFQASKFYDGLVTLLQQVHQTMSNNFCSVLLSVILNGLVVGSESTLLIADQLISYLGTPVGILGIRVCESYDLTVANLMVNGLQCVRNQHFPLWAFKRQPWSLTENYNPTPGLPWAEFATKVADRWTAHSMTIRDIPLAGAYLHVDKHSLLRHITISACLDMWENLVNNPSNIINWERVFTIQYTRMMRGGGKKWIPKSGRKDNTENGYSIIDGIKFPGEKLFKETSSYKNRCGAYAAYQIIDPIVNAGRIPSDNYDNLDHQYDFCQELAAFAGFVLEPDMLSTESVLALLMAYGIKCTIYRAREIDGKAYFDPIITSNYNKTFYSKEHSPTMRHILFTGHSSCGHYQPMEKESFKFMKKIDDNTVKFNASAYIGLPMITGPILKEFNPTLKRFVTSKRSTYPQTVQFTNKFIEIAARTFADVDLAHVFSCAVVDGQICRVLPRDIFVGSDQNYPQQWIQEDRRLHETVKETIKKVTSSSTCFQAKYKMLVEDNFSSIHIKNLSPISDSTKKAMDDFMTPRSSINVPPTAPDTTNVPGKTQSGVKSANVPPPPPAKPTSPFVVPKKDLPKPPSNSPPPIPPKPVNLISSTKSLPLIPPKPKRLQPNPEVEELNFVGDWPYLADPIVETDFSFTSSDEWEEPEIETIQLSDLRRKPTPKSSLPVFSTQRQIQEQAGVIFSVEPIVDEVPIHDFFNSFRKPENQVQYNHIYEYYDMPHVGEKLIKTTDQRIITYRNDKNMEHSQPSRTTIHYVGRKNQHNLAKQKARVDEFADAISICTKPTAKNIAQKVACIAAFPITVPIYTGLQCVRGVMQYRYEKRLLNSFERRPRKVLYDNAVIENLPSWVDYTGKSDAQASTIIAARVKVTCPFVNTGPRVAYGPVETNLLDGTAQFAQVHYHGRRLLADQAITSCRKALSREELGQMVTIQ